MGFNFTELLAGFGCTSVEMGLDIAEFGKNNGERSLKCSGLSRRKKMRASESNGGSESCFLCVWNVIPVTKPIVKSTLLTDVVRWYGLLHQDSKWLWVQGFWVQQGACAAGRPREWQGIWIPQRWIQLSLCPQEFLSNSRGDWDVCTKFISTQNRMNLVLRWLNKMLQQYRSGKDWFWMGVWKDFRGWWETERWHGFRK